MKPGKGGKGRGPGAGSPRRRHPRRRGICLSPEMVLATNIVMLLCRGAGAATVEGLARALGVAADGALLRNVIDKLLESGIVRSTADAPTSVFLEPTAGNVSLANVATAVGERLVCADGSEHEVLARIEHQLLDGWKSLDILSLAAGNPGEDAEASS